MQLDTINKLYLELSQVATAQTVSELKMKSVLQGVRDQIDEMIDCRASEISDKLRKITKYLDDNGVQSIPF